MFFFNNGVERQLNSTTETEANRNYAISCSICCSRGYNMGCEKCPIASANEQQKSAILDARKIERERKVKRYEQRKAVDELAKTAMKIYAGIRCPHDFEAHNDELEELVAQFFKLYE